MTERPEIPLSLKRQIDEIADEFEDAFKAKMQPSIEEYVRRLPEAARDLARKELLVVEIDLRRKRGDELNAREYLDRFPEHADAVNAAFSQAARTSDITSTQSLEQHKEPPFDRALDGPERIDRFEDLEKVGNGAFGVVYRAWDPDLEMEVALKVAGPSLQASKKCLNVLQTEARNAARLEHQGIVRILDVQLKSEPPFIRMQYINGQSLKEWASGQELRVEQVVRVLVDIALALGYAHQKGITHRDIKPANILIDRAESRPHIVDFGLALHESTQSLYRRDFAGSLAYMSPEQVRCETHRLDGRTDIWSLGVVMYELLTGSRPFEAGSRDEIKQLILSADPRPVRMRRPELPAELERICSKCLRERAADRYGSCAALLEDLKAWLDRRADKNEPIAVESEKCVTPPTKTDPPVIVPKGLRAFDEDDADFFHVLLPGPRDRDGLPEQIRFWKLLIEKEVCDETFAVGVIYGPSGCGKSSFLRAGLLPHLDPRIRTVYIEATAADTEVRLLRALRNDHPSIATVSLPECLYEVRTLHEGRTNQKTLIVLDQFEQWLHVNGQVEGHQLIEALRQCDGANLQCIVLVRDDFWIATSEFMRRLETPLLENQNAKALDLLPIFHADAVLRRIGRAMGVLPEELSPEHEQFIGSAVEGLANNDKVICVRLIVFAEMMKSRPWTKRTLQALGGTAGIGTRFLQEMLGSDAPLEHRRHGKAARAVLEALLPDPGAEIKGAMRSEKELQGRSGYARDSQRFRSLMSILDSELRLITPTDPHGDEVAAEGRQNGGRQVYYQLTHDYLVPTIRKWLTLEDRKRFHGRARLLLRERSAQWVAGGNSPSLLPSLPGLLSIAVLTKPSSWTADQRHMLKAAVKRHGIRLLLVAVVFALMSFVAIREYRQRMIETASDDLINASAVDVPRHLDKLKRFPSVAIRELSTYRAESDLGGQERRRVEFGLAAVGRPNPAFLLEDISSIPLDELRNLGCAIQACDEAVHDELWRVFQEDQRGPEWQYKSAAILFFLERYEGAEHILEYSSDNDLRTSFIDLLPMMGIGPEQLRAALTDTTLSPDTQAGLLTVLGKWDLHGLSPTLRQDMEDRVKQLYRSDAAVVHSMAAWLLRRWELAPPAGREWRKGLPTADDSWFVNPSGMTMVSVVGNGDTAQFFVSATEITRGQFEAFLNDQTYPIGNRPQDWAGCDADVSPTLHHPVQAVSWFDAVAFCNWLNWKIGLEPCFTRSGEMEDLTVLSSGVFRDIPVEVWIHHPDRPGYRLPTNDEWTLACRAGTTTPYFFGSPKQLLRRYGAHSPLDATAVMTGIPNPLGLFEIHGNVAEWCLGDAIYQVEARGPAGDLQREVLRGKRTAGGSYLGREEACRADARPSVIAAPSRFRNLGFRIIGRFEPAFD